MSNSNRNEDIDNAVIKFVGRPSQSDHIELSRWKKFIQFIWPWAKEGGRLLRKTKELTEANYTAEVLKKQNEAQKYAAEAIEITAKAEVLKQEKVKAVNDEIARIFSSGNNIPNEAKALQLATLIENNPQLSKQLDKIEALVRLLRYTHNVIIELDIDDKKNEL